MAKKLTTETEKPTFNFNEDVNFNSEPSKNVKDSWNQITLSLASKGGYTINHGRKLVLYVFIQEKINGKTVDTVKSFIVSKDELSQLENESREFSAEIETMLIAREKEQIEATPSKDTTKDKDTKKKEEKKTGKALTEVLKKGLNSLKKKEDPVITYGTSEGDIDDPDDGMVDCYSDDEYLARLDRYAEDFAKLVERDDQDYSNKKV